MAPDPARNIQTVAHRVPGSDCSLWMAARKVGKADRNVQNLAHSLANLGSSLRDLERKVRNLERKVQDLARSLVDLARRVRDLGGKVDNVACKVVNLDLCVSPRTKSMPVDQQARAIITLDDDGPADALRPEDRSVVFMEDRAIGFGFIAFAPHLSVISPGESVPVQVCFHGDAGTHDTLPLDIPMPIGTGSTRRGTLRIERWLPSHERRPIIPDALVTLRINALNSRGQPGIPVSSRLRPMVRRTDARSWYSFAMTDAAQTIDVGETATVAVAFVNPTDARVDFPEGTETVFGNGSAIFGSFVLERWLEAT